MSTEAFICEAIRTPCDRGKKTGSLHGVKPVSLVVGLIDEIRKRNPNLDVDRVSDPWIRDGSAAWRSATRRRR
ncbi:hypothetical protein FDG2_3431 [Candidatus Protofrankia californiensis]|uniref:Thiolase N-terminal domain-containing protein n=1 Tax=Candidatus Protofrankia californiensis TaxID=1839754 RepID=A0A1C3NZQ3_9ACTN|nr:hypothetical protein FDG2_3431 [Candidatus Protofrankia californiensis]